MSHFETEIFGNETDYFPRVWLRYVDDVFAIFDTTACAVDDFLVRLNNRLSTIKVTVEL